MVLMMALEMGVLPHFLLPCVLINNLAGVFTLKPEDMEKIYYFGFYRDHCIKGKTLICQVTDNMDSLSCELLGGIFPLLQLSLSRQHRDKVARELALQFGASYIEIGNSRKK